MKAPLSEGLIASTTFSISRRDPSGAFPFRRRRQLNTTIKKKKEMIEQNNNQPEQNAIRERISKHLREIEEQHHIKILYAVESGSRAWGFSSPDSDWDVRFIYVHEPEWYFHIEEQKDTIEQMFPDETDMSGWDLKKALRLFKSSNPSP
jgi:predicted nucleotidyltransferase